MMHRHDHDGVVARGAENEHVSPARSYYDNNRHRNQQPRRRNEHDSAQGEPQVEIMLQGLPLDCKEEDIRSVIEQEDIGLETIRLAKDRQTGIVRCLRGKCLDDRTATRKGIVTFLFEYAYRGLERIRLPQVYDYAPRRGVHETAFAVGQNW
ncbi:hypothetical protein BGZ68_009698 [Mortierella alpina]|nr:hypothetical protein BGZ68_009698 [Mortierella alpina]